MKRVLPILLAVPVLVGFGVAEGIRTDRWGVSEELESAAARVRHVPLTIGNWEGTERELDPRVVSRAEMHGYLSRQYVDRSSGAAVTVLLVCGKSGPTCVHTPDVCYPGMGYKQDGPATRHGHGNGSDAFWVGQFNKPGPVAEQLRIYWAWNAAGQWQAAENPRWQFAGRRALYKLYVVRHLAKSNEPITGDLSQAFLTAFLPEVHKALFTAP